MPTKKIYLILSQTGTFVSKLLKSFTHDEYNHISISTDPELKTMYSFGRRYSYFPLWGGFVRESPENGIYKRFPDSKITVLSINVEEAVFDSINGQLEFMLEHKNSYRYDIFGLILAAFNVVYTRKRYFYCSAFIKSLLVRHGIFKTDNFNRIVKPMDFIEMPNSAVVYSGSVSNMMCM